MRYGVPKDFSVEKVANLFAKKKNIYIFASAFGTGEYQSGQMGQTVNLLTYVFGGSNPSSPTINAEVAQLIEHQPSKLRVASLSLVFRSKKNPDGFSVGIFFIRLSGV